MDSAAHLLYPNPNNGDQLTLTLYTIEAGVRTVSVDFFDTFGKRVGARTIAVSASSSRDDGNAFLNTVIDLRGELAAGMYTVSVTAGQKNYTERMVVQP